MESLLSTFKFQKGENYKMVSTQNFMPNLFEFARKKFNGDFILMTSYIVEVFDKANLLHLINNSQKLEDIKISYADACLLAKKSNIPLNQLLN